MSIGSTTFHPFKGTVLQRGNAHPGRSATLRGPCSGEVITAMKRGMKRGVGLAQKVVFGTAVLIY